jgi:hypothetical protein
MATEGKKKKSTKGPAPKAPQDRKPKKQKAERPEDVPGFDMLRPMSDVPIWDQTPLLGLVAQLTDSAGKDGKIDMDEKDAIPLLGMIAKAMLPFAKDEDAFTKFCSGKDALQRVMDLAMAWVAALGEDESSANN